MRIELQNTIHVIKFRVNGAPAVIQKTADSTVNTPHSLQNTRDELQLALQLYVTRTVNNNKVKEF
jgi:hypothetical protein